MEKILDIVELIAYEKNLSKDLVIQAVKEAMIKMAEGELGEADYTVIEDEKARTLKLMHNMTIVANDDENAIDNPRFITLDRAKIAMGVDLDNDAIGKEIAGEINLQDMNRGAVNKLFLDLEYLLQKKLEERLYEKYQDKLHKLISGVVINVDSNQDTFVEIEDIRATLPFKNRIKGESFKKGDTIIAVLQTLKLDKNGITLRLSRTSPKLLAELMTLEVPEIKDGDIEIKNIARIPGVRAKVALLSHNAKIDPIGSSVGVKGVRINAVSSQLNGENIDCIEYSDIDEIFITRAIAPAKVISVKILSNTEIEKKALVTLIDSEKAKAIGKNGVNISLTSMLTGFSIEFNVIAPKEESTKDCEEIVEKAENKLGLDALESLFKK